MKMLSKAQKASHFLISAPQLVFHLLPLHAFGFGSIEASKFDTSFRRRQRAPWPRALGRRPAPYAYVVRPGQQLAG